MLVLFAPAALSRVICFSCQMLRSTCVLRKTVRSKDSPGPTALGSQHFVRDSCQPTCTRQISADEKYLRTSSKHIQKMDISSSIGTLELFTTPSSRFSSNVHLPESL